MWVAGLGVAALVWIAPARASSVDELLREARAHEAAHDEDRALRCYTDAIALDGACAECYLGLASLRMRLGDPREAERVYSLGLERVPSMHVALVGRARARRANGKSLEAARDIEDYAGKEGDPRALRELARWHGEDRALAMQLAVWRKILVSAAAREDEPLAREARTMIRALQIVLGPVDPVSAPAAATPFRLAVAHLARRAD